MRWIIATFLLCGVAYADGVEPTPTPKPPLAMDILMCTTDSDCEQKAKEKCADGWLEYCGVEWGVHESH